MKDKSLTSRSQLIALISRRQFITALAAGGVTGLIAPRALPNSRAHGTLIDPRSPVDSRVDPWNEVPRILRRIKPPKFPNRSFDITRFGAVSDGATDCTEAFRKGIDACNKAGGGRLVVPAGTFLTGPIHLKSNVNVHVSEGATIKFSQDPARYLPLVFSRWEGVELMNYSPLFYAFQQENIAITGKGTLDGQADETHWWPWKGRNTRGGDQGAARRTLMEMAEKGVPVAERIFGEGHYLRPQFIQPYSCRNILIEGITIKNSPMWEIHPVLCTNVTVKGVSIVTHGPNNDGCDPESCTDVLIKDCYFDTGDDCIAIKSGRNADGRRLMKPSQNIVIQGCRMKDGHGGVTIGSEISGGARNIFAEDCQMDSPNLDRVLRLKNNAMRGGLIENVYMRNVDVGQISDAAISIDFYYEEGDKGGFTPVARAIGVRNLKVGKSKYALYLRGFKQAPITNILLEDCVFDEVARASVVEHAEGITLNRVRANGKLLTEP